MTAKRRLLVLGLVGGLAGVLVWVAPPGPAAVRQPAAAGGGVHGSVLVRIPNPGDERKRDTPIPLPDVEVALKNLDTGDVGKPQVTDLFGRYMFPPQKQGTYQLVWAKQNGWDAGTHPRKIVVTGNTQYPLPAEVKAEKDHVVLSGRVRMKDGGSPWFADEFFGLTKTATVTLTDPAGAAVAKPVRANFAGDYAVAAAAKRKFRVKAASDGAKADRVLAAADFRADGTPLPLDLDLDSRRPRVSSVVVKLGGQVVRHAPAGAAVELAATADDPDGDALTFTWKVTGGTVAGMAASVKWQLPPAPGVYTAYVVVSDGRGGDVQARVAVAAGAAGDTFSGRVVDPAGKPVPKAAVAVNGVKATTDGNGAFRVAVPPDKRYVLNVARAGFVPLSRVYDAPKNGHFWRLTPVQVTEVDPTQPVVVVDRRPVLEKRRQRGAAVEVPANALVDAAGNPPAGNLSVAIATLDLSKDEAPGDWLARDGGGGETGIVSFGLVFVAFADAAGTAYNLAAGQTAEVTIPIPPGMAAAPPPQMPVWAYDAADGYWKPLGPPADLDAAAKVYRAKVPHFSFINMDQPGPVTCLKVHTDISLPTGLRLRVSDVAGDGLDYVTVKEEVLDGPLNAVFRIPPNQKVRLEVLDANGTLLPNAVVEDGNTVKSLGTPLPGNEVTSGAANPDLWPPFPYDGCKEVTLKLDALWSGYPGSPFLGFKGVGTDAQATAYYAAVDPMNTRGNLTAWWAANGFDATGAGPPGSDYARTSYLNDNDLGSGRDMHFLKHPDGTLSAYVTNYSRNGLFDQNPVFADDAAAKNIPGATVCMEYKPVAEGDPTAPRVVKFFVYGAGGGKLNSADLDGLGEKFVPNLCLNCHGGSYTPPDVNMGSSFRELDVATYKYPGFRATPDAAEQAAFKLQNQYIQATGAARMGIAETGSARKPILDLIADWYKPGGMGLNQDNSYTPSNWLGSPRETLYHDVVKGSCRTCHIAFVSDDSAGGNDWNRYDQMVDRRGDAAFSILDLYTVGDTIAPPSSRVMPHALVTYRMFWLTRSPHHRPQKFWDYTDLPAWPPIGPPGP